MFIKNKVIQRLFHKLEKLIKSDNVIIFLGILSILPIIAISYYINPSADDYYYYVKAQEIGYWDAQYWFYENYNGRFITSVILTLKIWVSGSLILYKLIPICVLFLLFYSLFKLFSTLFTELNKRDHIILTFYLLIIYLVQMPSIAEGLYWLSSTVCYQSANISTVFLLVFIIKLLRTSNTKYLFLSFLFAFLIIGLNEISMLSINFLICSIILYKYLHENKIHSKLLMLLLFSILISVVVYYSPGNAKRSSYFQDKHQLLALEQSIFAMKRQIEKWLPFIIFMTFIFFNYFGKKTHNKNSIIFSVNPIYVTCILFCTVFIGFFTSFWAMGHPPPARAVNNIYFFFLLGLIYLFFIIFIKLKNNNKIFISFSNWAKYLLIVVLYIFLTGDKPHINNVRSAYADFLSGSAYNYDLELKKRYELINNCETDTCYVPILNNKPYTIYTFDITEDPKNGKNLSFGSFYYPKKIIIGVQNTVSNP